MQLVAESNRIAGRNESGEIVAELNFNYVSDGSLSVNRTFVDDSLGGQGIASLLMREVCALARARGVGIIPKCSYAEAWFAQHPNEIDLLRVIE